MAELDPVSTNPDLQDALRLGGLEDGPTTEDTGPLYRIGFDSRIPVSKDLGRLYKSRIDQSIAARKDIETCWTEAIRYYENDQMGYRQNSDNRSNNVRYTRSIGTEWSETENVVFSNAITVLPMIYSKNPSCEITANSEANAKFATALERVVNKLMTMKTAPGVNLKSKARRGVLTAMLTNSAYIKTGWTAKKDSSEEAIVELQRLSSELENAKDAGVIQEVEGKIKALEERIAFLTPSGPTTVLRSPFRIFADPTGMEPDHSDCNWLAEWDYLPTTYINAVYAKKVDQQYRSVYEPTHILQAGANVNTIEDEVNNFQLINRDNDLEAGNYGYRSIVAFNSAKYTKVWHVWDKTTRRVFLFADNKWEWPLWVWDDPLKLLEFFPYYRLHFHETPEGSQPKGEVTYYLDQQDTINDVKSTVNQARKWAKRNVFYDKNRIKQSDVEAVLKGDDGTARGVDVPEGGKLTDVIQSFVPPAMQHPELLSIDQSMQTIERITGISGAQKGGQFKTNTTNDAVDFYKANADIRIDEKIDAVEDWIGDIAWSIAQMCVRYWTPQEVGELIGAEYAADWKQITDTNQLRTMFNFRVVGGSTSKPTSKAKKEEAIQIGQVIGQFAKASPAAVIVMLRVLQRAFDEVVITEKDWEMVMQSIQQQMQQPGQDTGSADAGGEGSPEEKAKIEQVLKSLPPEAKAELQQAIAQGASPTEALRAIVEKYQSQQPPAK